MYRVLYLLAALPPLAAAPAASPSKLAAGRKEMMAACQSCHPLNVIQLRRFPREDWDAVLRKMTNLGAKIRNRQALLDYLTVAYGEKESKGR